MDTKAISTPVILIILFTALSSVAPQQQPLPYSPADNIIIDCGSSGTTPAEDHRPWSGDISSKFFPLEGKNGESTTLNPNNMNMNGIHTAPYGTARLSRSEFTYTIPVTPGPKFLRLYFYSADYGDFNISKSFFSVRTGKYSLLRNFSVSLAADALGFDTFMKEYIVSVDQSSLRVTFAPESSNNSGAFAVVSGIEVVSMPDSLYYSPPDRSREITNVELGGLYTMSNYTAMETMYRVNMGGTGVSPSGDTGMFRTWDSDEDYLTNRGVNVQLVNNSVTLDYRNNLTNYAAPTPIYRTSRSTGYNISTKEMIKSYNLTWQFSVDSGFSYMLRLHFCEILAEIEKVGDREFYVWIADQLAERHMDVFRMSGGKYVPYFRDFRVLDFKKPSGQKRVILSVALQATPDDRLTTYADATMNGLEIFKLNNSDGNLAGLNRDPIIRLPAVVKEGKKNQTAKIIGIIAGVVLSVFVVSALGFFIIRRGKSVKDSASGYGTTKWGPISMSTTKSTKTRGSSTLPADLCRYFSLSEIRTATNNFEDMFIIGVGGFGNVYKGYIDNGITPVAIKRLKSESSQGAHEFKTEIEMLSHLRHRHLVSLIGYSDDHGEMILVYEYMSRGTLRDHLYKTDNPPLPWSQRLDICIGAARGLHYLHTGAKHTIIHRDVKTTNILLDEKWVAKVSDFGLSKTGPTSISKAHVSTVVKGSIGYLDPEYYRRQQLSEKSDVYSFGVVLCEVLSGRAPIVRNAAERKQVSLAEWARSCHRNGTMEQIVDPHLVGKISAECLRKFGEIAVNCMHDNGAERPSMNDVVWGLEFALQLQDNAEDSNRVGGVGGEALNIGHKDKDKDSSINNDTDGSFTCSWDDTSEVRSSGATKISSTDNNSTNDSLKVFSEIYDPQAR